MVAAIVMIGRHAALRTVVSAFAPVLGAAVCVPAVVVLATLGSFIGDKGTLALLAMLALFWFSSASLGSTVIVAFDLAVSAIVRDFRTRAQLAVLGLISVVSGIAVGVYAIGRASNDALGRARSGDVPEGLVVNLGDAHQPRIQPDDVGAQRNAARSGRAQPRAG